MSILQCWKLMNFVWRIREQSDMNRIPHKGNPPAATSLIGAWPRQLEFAHALPASCRSAHE
jgi:hypothetical protein